MFIMKAGVLSLMMACLTCCSGRTTNESDKLECRTIEVKGGYGYVVFHGKDTLIHQPFIPAVSGKRPFSTKEDAMKIGQLVCRKLSEYQLPAVTGEEVASSGIKY